MTKKQVVYYEVPEGFVHSVGLIVGLAAVLAAAGLGALVVSKTETRPAPEDRLEGTPGESRKSRDVCRRGGRASCVRESGRAREAKCRPQAPTASRQIKCRREAPC